METLVGKRALVTGAASGIGRRTALELAREGADLLLVDIDGEGLGKVAGQVEEMGAEAHTFQIDVSDWEGVKGLADTVHARWGALDVLVNNAGVAIYRDIVFTSMEEWERLIGINLWGPIHFVHAFVPEMIRRRSGHVVNVASWVALFSFPGSGAYNATKCALHGFSDALRFECHRCGVRVTTVYPVVVATHFYDLVEGNLWTRLGMRVFPLISHKPETLAKKIVQAVLKRKRRVLVGPASYITFYFSGLFDHVLELVGRLVARMTCREEP